VMARQVAHAELLLTSLTTMIGYDVRDMFFQPNSAESRRSNVRRDQQFFIWKLWFQRVFDERGIFDPAGGEKKSKRRDNLFIFLAGLCLPCLPLLFKRLGTS
jgi:hypothetical protein